MRFGKNDVQQLSSVAGKLQSPGRQSPARYFTSNSNIGRTPERQTATTAPIVFGGSSRIQAQGAKLAASAAQPPGGAGPAFCFGAPTAEPPRAQRDLFGSGRTLAVSSNSAGDSGAAANGVAAPSSPEPRQLPHFSFQSQPQPRAPAGTPACRPVPHGSATKSAAAAAAAAARIPLPDDCGIRTPAAATAAAEARIPLPADPRVSVNGLSSRFDDAVHVTDSAAHLHSRFASTVQMNGSGGAEERGASENVARRFAGTQLRQSDGSDAVVQPGLRPAENASGARAADPHAGAIGGGSGAAAASTAAESAAEQAPQSQASAPTVQQLPQRHQPEPQPVRSPGPMSQQPAAAQPAVAVDSMPPAHAERPMQPDAALAAEPLPPTQAPTAAAAAWQAQPEIAQQPTADSPAASRLKPRQRATHGSFVFSSSPAGGVQKPTFTAGAAAAMHTLQAQGTARRPGRRPAAKAAASPAATPATTPAVFGHPDGGAATPLGGFSPMDCSPCPPTTRAAKPHSAVAPPQPLFSTSPLAASGARGGAASWAGSSAPHSRQPAAPAAPTSPMSPPKASRPKLRASVAERAAHPATPRRPSSAGPAPPPPSPTQPPPTVPAAAAPTQQYPKQMAPASPPAPAPFAFRGVGGMSTAPSTPTAPQPRAQQPPTSPQKFGFTFAAECGSASSGGGGGSAAAPVFYSQPAAAPKAPAQRARAAARRRGGAPAAGLGTRRFGLHFDVEVPQPADHVTAAAAEPCQPQQYSGPSARPAGSDGFAHGQQAPAGTRASDPAAAGPLPFSFGSAVSPEDQPRPALSPQAAAPTPRRTAPAVVAVPGQGPAPALRARSARRGGRARSGAPAAPAPAQPAAPDAEGKAESAGRGAAADTLTSGADAAMQRGNADFNVGQYPAAEAAYSQAILLLEGLPTGAATLAKLYSNRAAARLMQGAPLDSLDDCRKALQASSLFRAEANAAYTRAAVRGATCHLRLGDFGAAAAMLRASESAAVGTAAAKELADKLAEVAQLQKDFSRVEAQILEGATGAEALKVALAELDKLLPSLAAAPPAFSLRAHALLRLGRREEALAAANWQRGPQAALAATDAWLWWTQAQAALLAGSLSEAESALQSPAALRHMAAPPAGASPDALLLRLPSEAEAGGVLADAHQRARLKDLGNTAIKAGDHAAAVRHYTAALGMPRPPLPGGAAVLHANRGAAHQGAGALAEGIADCGRARALDPSYAKALSRLATLWLEVGRPAAAVEALEALEGLSKTLSGAERGQLAARLRAGRAAAAAPPRPDHYRLLGLQRSATADDVRKAYKKFALRMHPDKAAAACRFSSGLLPGARLIGDAPAIEAAVLEQANRLFALVSEANSVLSDPVRRQEYDAVHNLRTAANGRTSGTSSRRSGFPNSAYTRSGSAYQQQYGPHGSGAYYRRPAGSGGYSSFYGRPPPRQQPQYTWGSDEEGEEYYGGAYSSAGAWDYY